MTLHCLHSGEEFSPTRSNQKFASAQNRINYHNSKMCSVRKSRSFVDTKLHKNYRILNELMVGKVKVSFHKQFMLGKGYSFDVLTHFEDEDGKKYKAVYEYLVFEQGETVHLKKYK
jgi:hypothetical protein